MLSNVPKAQGESKLIANSNYIGELPIAYRCYRQRLTIETMRLDRTEFYCIYNFQIHLETNDMLIGSTPIKKNSKTNRILLNLTRELHLAVCDDRALMTSYE